ncbi:MAG: hypothetical protein IJP98_03455 [Clostridia bacterium]|nr:hypothetical protein [Clostridia bacterium]
MNNFSEKQYQESAGRTTLFERAFCFVWVMVFAYMIVRPVTNNASLIRIIWIPSLLLLFILSFRQTISLRFFLELMIPIGIIVFSAVTDSGAADKDHLLAAFCYVNMFFVVEACTHIKPSRRTFDLIFYSNVLLSLLFLLYTFTPIANRVHTNEIAWTSKYLVYDMGNSNLAAMFLFSFYCILLINLAYRKHKIPIVLLMAADLYMIYGTNCRSVLLAVVAVTAAYFFIGRRKLPTWIVVFGALSPIWFAGLYLLLYYAMDGQVVILLNKNLFSGRQNIFIENLGYITDWKSLLFGNFAKAGLQNAHNIAVSVLASLGVLGLAAFLGFHLRTMLAVNRQETTAIRTLSLVCILGIFIQSSMEATFFLGGFPGIIFLSTFIILSNFDDYAHRAGDPVTGTESF